jgi:hypothetical protein
MSIKINAHTTISPRTHMEFAKLSAKLDIPVLKLYNVALMLGYGDLQKLFTAKGGRNKINKLTEEHNG